MGAMKPLLVKLDKLLQDPPQRCFSKKVKDLMRLLRDDAEKISSYLDKLSVLEDPPLAAKCWMNEARDLSYDMDDYINSLLSRPPDPSGAASIMKATRSLRKLSNHVKTPKSQTIITETLSDFRIYVQEAIERHARFGLHSCSTLRHRFVSPSPMLPTQYDEGTAHIVVDGRMNQFINSLVPNDGADQQQLKVVSVFGPSCLGKTTLAKVLYNRIQKQYHCRAFVRVSKKPDMKRIFRDMLSQLQQQDPPQDCKEVVLIDRIKECLEDKRYLIIVDDVWAASVWHIMSHVFPGGCNGSRIVTTTQIKDVALTCCCYQSKHVFEMKPLDDHHSRKLFFNRLFGSESDCPEQLKEVLNEIVEICGGLPLATVSIASLLASQPTVTTDLLTYIHQSLRSCFSANPTSERTRQALNLSFNNLPQYLKTCLLYLSMYQESYTFCKDDLVKQWMAEGFIDTIEGQDMVEVAESYLDQLIGRRFIQPMCINYNNEMLSCTVHDVVHDLIALKSTEENFIVAIDHNQKNVALSHKARRLSLLFGDARYARTPANIIKAQVRSLAYSGLFESMSSIIEFKLLRILNLQLSGHGGNDDPVDLTGISELFQLRYLKVACYRSIVLPKHGLRGLETLDITDARLDFVSRDIRFPRLLHLSLPFGSSTLLFIIASSSKYLEDLHLTVSSTDSYDLESKTGDLYYFLSEHGKLKILVVAHRSSVKNNVVRGSSEVSASWDNLTPPLLLQRFECSPRCSLIFNNIPKWVGKLGNLRILKIAVRELMMNCVDILRGLPALTALSLYVQRAPIERIIFDKAGFSVLKYFKLRFSSGIAWLTFEADAMPNLWKLKLVFNAVPPMDQHISYSSNQGTFKRHQLGTAVISIKHMPGLKEVSVKIGGAAGDVEYASRTFISNHPSNPTVNMQLVDHSSYGDESTQQKQQPNRIMDEYAKATDKPASKRISRSPEPSSPVHVQGEWSRSIQLDVNWEVSSRYPPEWVGWIEFTLDELRSATSNFSEENLLGEANFGRIYKGTVEGKVVAIVKFKYRSWLPELEYRGKMHHPHLVRLLGYCNDDRDNILVYEYMPSGSVFEINLLASLPWLTRLKIAVGAAKGLAFLHESSMQMMYYTGFKASSIMLDSDYTAKLWGFVLTMQNDIMWDMTKKSNVRDFGVLLLELLAGRPYIDKKRLGPEENLVEWSRPYLHREGKLHRLMDPRLEGKYSLSAAWSTAKIVRRCLQSACEKRPSMHDVVEALEPLLSDDRNDGQLLASGKPESKTRLSQFFISSKTKQAEEVEEPTTH